MSSSIEDREELLEILLKASKDLEEVKDCYIYLIGVNEEDLTKVFIYEVWKNEEAHKNSLKLPAVQKLIEKAKPIIKDMDSFPTLIIKGGKGIK
ncbi:hypothetical protein CKO19_16900 [Rhodovulum adriaticum]|nr:hypothetical protein [Rhodovulum adriaticum]